MRTIGGVGLHSVPVIVQYVLVRVDAVVLNEQVSIQLMLKGVHRI